jgi:uncharacterized protein YcbX
MRISALYVYPVKACRAVAVETAAAGALGLENDRRFALVADDGLAFTQRDQPLLATVVPQLDAEALRLDLGGLAEVLVPLSSFTKLARVDVWGNGVPARAAPSHRELDDYLGAHVRVVMLDHGAQRSFADSRPVLVATSAMLARLGLPDIGMERFRANVVLEGDGKWRKLRGEHVLLEYCKQCGRCEVTTIDQASGAQRGPEPLRTLNERFDGNFGEYYGVARPGRLRRGEDLLPA